MTTTDIVILILLLWGAINGFIKGFVVQILTLLALVFGVWIAVKLHGPMGILLAKWLSVGERIMTILSFSLVFILVLVGIYFLGKLITHLMGKSTLGRLNRIGGVLFGILKMAFIISVVLFIVEKTDSKHKLVTTEYKQKSWVYKPVSKLAPAIFPGLVKVKDKLLKEKED